jgi:hypothetical protein
MVAIDLFMLVSAKLLLQQVTTKNILLKVVLLVQRVGFEPTNLYRIGS